MTQAAPIPATVPCPLPELLKEPLEPPKVSAEELVVTREPKREYSSITSTSCLSITKQFHVRKAMSLQGTMNKYMVKCDGDLLYTVEEESKPWVGYVCFGLRPLELKVMDAEGAEVVRVKRAFACTSRLFPCQLQRLEVYTPVNELLGSVEQVWSVLAPTYTVKDSDGQDVYKISGPGISISCFRDVVFFIEKMDGSAVGSTSQRWLGLRHYLFVAPIRNHFGVTFDQGLPADHKLLLFAATLLIEYMYYG